MWLGLTRSTWHASCAPAQTLKADVAKVRITRIIAWLASKLAQTAVWLCEQTAPAPDPDRQWWVIRIADDQGDLAETHTVPGRVSENPDDNPDYAVAGDGPGHELSVDCACMPSIGQESRLAHPVISHKAWEAELYQ